MCRILLAALKLLRPLSNLFRPQVAPTQIPSMPPIPPAQDETQRKRRPTTPLLVAHPAPFRFIQRNQSDVLNITTEQVNRGTYNYAKLHRATSFFDANLLVSHFTLCVAYNGAFIVPRTKEYASLEMALDEFNRIFAAILIGGVYINAISTADLAFGEMTSEGYYRDVEPFGHGAALYKALGEADAGPYATIDLVDPPTILASELEVAYRAGAAVLKPITNLSAALFITAFTYFQSGQMRESLTHAWISIEQLIENAWELMMVGPSKTVNIEGRRRFLESQQWTAAHKIELLYQQKLLGSNEYTMLTKARHARNAFIHKGNRPESDEVEQGLRALIAMLSVCSELHGSTFDKANLEKHLITSATPLHRHVHSSSGGADKIDWSKVSHWKPIKALPGEWNWDGEFESFDDIKLINIPVHNGV